MDPDSLVPTVRLRHPEPGFAQVEEMDPGARSQNWMSVLSIVLLALGLAIGVGVATWRTDSSQFVLVTPRAVLSLLMTTLAATVATLVAHEAIHGLAMLLCGARPRFGAGMMHTGLPYLYTTTERHLFTRAQFVMIAGAPNVLVNLALIVTLVLGPHPSWWVVPLAVHLSGGVGDMWLVWSAMHEQRTSRIEDLRAGLRVHRRAIRPNRPLARPAS